ncbi:MAG: sigma-70 family RNA polymerase sigma factor [Acidobacteriota bacterium]|nr:sigma-70 family RNA polymerase sigma factor [Acidobacteriota bacterium]
MPESPDTLAESPIPDPAALARRDEQAWTTLLDAQGPRLLAVARRFLRDEDAARDCLQTAFLQALRNVGRFEGRSSLGTWLHRIVVNTALLTLRSRRRKPEESLDPLLPVFDRSGYRMPVGPVERTPEEIASGGEARELIQSAIDLLPESYRTVVILRDLEDLSGQEVAELLETTPNAVKVRLHRAHSALKTLLEMPKERIRISRVREVCRWVLGAPARAIPLVITCREFEDFVVDFLDGSLPPGPRRLFELHLRTCHECRQYLARYRQTLALSLTLRDEPLLSDIPRGLLRAIAGAIQREG